MSGKHRDKATDEEIAIDSLSNYVYALRNLFHSQEDLRQMGNDWNSVTMALGEFADKDMKRYQIHLSIVASEDQFVPAQEVKVS